MSWLVACILLLGSLSTETLDQAKASLAHERAETARVLAAAAAESAMFGGNDSAVVDASWKLLPETVNQGDAVMVRSKTKGSVVWMKKSYPLLPFGAGFYTLLPIAIDAKPGDYKIGSASLRVKAKKFEEQRIQVTQEQEQMQQNTARINKDQLKINKARSHSEPTFLYTDHFIQPVQGILTTPYGFMRYVNGQFSGSHRAIDLAAPTGTPVKAANAGIVILAETLYLTGNSIYIDHGMNLFSQYAHMSKLAVKTGDRVTAGQVIGYVGTTGFSTGPHLHFAFWIGNEPVNPNLFFDSTPFLWR